MLPITKSSGTFPTFSSNLTKQEYTKLQSYFLPVELLHFLQKRFMD